MASLFPDEQVRAGVLGQVIGHGAVWAKQVAGGRSVGDVLSTQSLFWAGFNIATEWLSSYASDITGTQIAGVAVPAGVQIATLKMYNPDSKQTISRLAGGDVTAVMDDPFIAGTIGSLVLKSYA